MLKPQKSYEEKTVSLSDPVVSVHFTSEHGSYVQKLGFLVAKNVPVRGPVEAVGWKTHTHTIQEEPFYIEVGPKC